MYAEPADRFKKQFSTYLADGVGSEDIEEIYTNAYAAIREDPAFKPTEKTTDWATESKKYRTLKLTLGQRKQRIQEKIEAFRADNDENNACAFWPGNETAIAASAAGAAEKPNGRSRRRCRRSRRTGCERECECGCACGGRR